MLFTHGDINIPGLEELTDDDSLGLEELVGDDLAPFVDLQLDRRGISPTSRATSRAASPTAATYNNEEAWTTEGQ